MKNIPILGIEQFEQNTQLEDFYSNNLSTHLNQNKAYFHKPHRHNFFLCVLFSKGSGIHEIDFKKYVVQTGSVFFLRPGQTHYWKFNSPVEGYIFFHTQAFYELQYTNSKLDQFPFYFSFKNPPLVHIDLEALKILELRFKDINNEYHDHQPMKRLKLAGLLNTVYIDLTRHYMGPDEINYIIPQTYIRTLRALEKLIDSHYKSKKMAKFYANSLNISTKHLNRIIKTTLNKTTTELITERVILESKRLIVHSNNSLATISQILGYEDYAHFSKLFKLKTKTTPLGFKKNYR